MGIRRRWRLTRARGYLLALVLIASIAIVQGVASVAFAVTADRRLQDAALDTYSYVGDLTTERVARYVEVAESAVVTTVLEITRGDRELSSENLINSLYQRMLAAPDVRAMYVGEPDGKFTVVERDGGGFSTRVNTADGQVTMTRTDSVFSPIGEPVVAQTEYDPRVRPWYLAGESASHVSWTEPYVSYTDPVPLVSVALAARERPTGDPIAIVGADLSLDALGEMLDDLPFGDGAEAFVLSEQSQVIAVPSDYRARLEAFVVAHDSVPYAVDLGIVTNGPPQGADATQFTEQGAYVALDQTFPAEDNLDWYIHMTADSTQLSSELGGTREMLGWIALYSFVVTVIAAVLIWQVRRPLRHLRESAARDALTGLVNRDEFSRRGQVLLERALDQGDAVVATMLDLDNFKALNDWAGHDAGDQALVAAALAMRDSTRGRDVAARFGGDEFVTLHLVRHVDDAEPLVARVRDAVEENIHALSEDAEAVGVTAGFAVAGPGRAVDLAALMSEADERLVAGKRTEKGKIYGPSSDPSD